jgi:hypothetical protein
MATSFSGGRSRGIRREPPTMGKQKENRIVEKKYICLFNLLILRVLDEGYSRNAFCALN